MAAEFSFAVAHGTSSAFDSSLLRRTDLGCHSTTVSGPSGIRTCARSSANLDLDYAKDFSRDISSPCHSERSATREPIVINCVARSEESRRMCQSEIAYITNMRHSDKNRIGNSSTVAQITRSSCFNSRIPNYPGWPAEL